MAICQPLLAIVILAITAGLVGSHGDPGPHDHIHSHGSHNHYSHRHHHHDHNHYQIHGRQAEPHLHLDSHAQNSHQAHRPTRKVMISRSKDFAKEVGVNYAAWAQALLATIVIGLAPVLILQLIPSDIGHRSQKSQNFLKVLLAFAVGGLLGDVFLHLLPHAMENHSNQTGHHSHNDGSGFWVLIGILLFLAIEKFILTIGSNSHGHSHSENLKPPKQENFEEKSTEMQRSGEQQTLRNRRKVGGKKDYTNSIGNQSMAREIYISPSAYLNLAADFTHNFTDGLAIGSTFSLDSKVGLVTVLAILLHEIPHEIGDFAILIQAGFSRKAAMRMQIWTALGAMLGTILGLLTEGGTPESSWIMPMTAGGFLYIAMSSAIPEILKPSSSVQAIKEMSAILLGIGLMATISFLE